MASTRPATSIILTGLMLASALTGCGQPSAPLPQPATVTVSGQPSPPPSATTSRPVTQSPPGDTAPPAGTPAPTSTVIVIPNPNGDGSIVPCEGTICTNPNHGAGNDGEPNDAPPEPGQSTFTEDPAG